MDIWTYDGAGSAYVRCLVNVVPSTELLRQRRLSAEEVTRLVGLVHDGKLLAGDYIGIDGTHSDGVFETLRFTLRSETGVLVTSGNTSFTAGARRSLLEWLQTLMRELQDKPEPG